MTADPARPPTSDTDADHAAATASAGDRTSKPEAPTAGRPATATNAWGPRAWRDDLVAGALFLTRLPVRWTGPWPDGLAVRAMRAWPLVGAAVGLAVGAAAAGAAAIGLPPLLAGLIGVAVAVVATGGLHEDGLADLADGLGGGRDRAAKLAIMRDSRIGSYGVLALVLGVGARAAALGALAAAGPAAAIGGAVAAGAAARAGLPVLLRRLPPARPDGLGRGAGRPGAGIEATAVGLGAGLALAAAGLGIAPWAGPVALGAAVAAAGLVAGLARRQIGGQTGDVLGAAQQAMEIAILAACAAAIA
jgi:adenosylcobinamide-GDP ribazoletransferase